MTPWDLIVWGLSGAVAVFVLGAATALVVVMIRAALRAQ